MKVEMEEDGDKCLESGKGWSEVRMDRWIGNNGSKAGHTVFGQRRDTTDRSPSRASRTTMFKLLEIREQALS